MNPVGNHILISFVDEEEEIIHEKQPYTKVIAVAISPDLTVPFLKHAELYIAQGKHFTIKGQFYINASHVALYK